MRPLLLVPLLLLTAAAPADERRFMAANFERLRVDGPFEVEVVPGVPAASASGDPRALEQVTVRVDGDLMVVSPGPLSWRDPREKGVPPPRIRISVPMLRSVVVNGAAQVHVAEMRGAVELRAAGAATIDVASIKADEIGVNMTGSGLIRVAGTAVRARIRNYGKGMIDAAALTAGEAVLNTGDSGGIRIDVRYTARASALGTGSIDITGRPECLFRGTGPMTCTGTIRRL